MEKHLLHQLTMNSLFWERHHPSIISSAAAIAITVCYAYWSPLREHLSITDNTLGVCITVGAIFTGFDAIGRNIILSQTDKNIIKIINSSYKTDLLRYINASLNSALFFIFVSLFFLLIKYDSCLMADYVKLLLWSFSLFHMLLAYRRSHSILQFMSCS